MLWRGWPAIGAAAVLALFAASARAGEPAEADRARLATLLRSGADAAKAKHWDDCVTALGAALAIDGAATTAGDLGLCEEGASKFALAFRDLRRALEAAPTDAKDPWTKYRAAMARVRERVAVVLVTAYPSAARVVVDGRPLGPADGRGVAVEPGTHTFAARLDGYDDATETRTMAARDVPQVHLQLKPKPQAPAPATPPQTSAKPVSPAPSPTRAPAPAPWYKPAWSPRGVLVSLAYASAATLLVSGETALALEIDRQSKIAKLGETGCGPGSSPQPAPCTALHERVVQRNAAEGVFIGTTIATGVFAGATGLVNVLGRSPLRPSVAVNASPYGGGIAVVGTW
jgi:hypothetical protein